MEKIMKKFLVSLTMLSQALLAQNPQETLKNTLDAQEIKKSVHQAMNEENALRTSGIDVNGKVKKVFTDDDFYEVDWHGKDYSYTVFSSVDFTDSDLSGADFSYAVFSNADFHHNNLDGACFYGAKFYNTDIYEGNSLINTNFSNINQSNFDIGADTNKVIWKDEPCGAAAK